MSWLHQQWRSDGLPFEDDSGGDNASSEVRVLELGPHGHDYTRSAGDVAGVIDNEAEVPLFQLIITRKSAPE